MCECLYMDEVLGRASEALSEYVSRPAYRLSDEELTAGIVDLSALVSRAMAARAQFVREAQGRDLRRSAGAASTTSWLKELLLVSGSDGRRVVSLGELLDSRPVLGERGRLGGGERGSG